MRPSLVIVEGNISAGKSTLTRDLAATLGYRVFLEPTTTNPYLADFYRDPKRFALKMQIYMLRRRYRVYLAALKHIVETGEGAVLDRSIFSDWVFAEKNRLDGNIDSEGFWYYTQLRAKMLEQLPYPHFTVYLDVAPGVCHERIHGVRKRAAEVDSGIPLEYLQGLDTCYQLFLREMRAQGSTIVSFDWANFGSVDQIKSEMVRSEAAAPAAPWNASILKMVTSSRDNIRERMRVSSDEDQDWSDEDEDDLIASNQAELQTLAPQSPGEDARG